MTTVAEVNRALRKAGIPERIRRARGGYFQVYEGEAANWYESGIYTSSLSGLSTELVVGEVTRMREAYLALKIR
jgi:hypothetical protein